MCLTSRGTGLRPAGRSTGGGGPYFRRQKCSPPGEGRFPPTRGVATRSRVSAKGKERGSSLGMAFHQREEKSRHHEAGEYRSFRVSRQAHRGRRRPGNHKEGKRRTADSDKERREGGAPETPIFETLLVPRRSPVLVTDSRPARKRAGLSARGKKLAGSIRCNDKKTNL